MEFSPLEASRAHLRTIRTACPAAAVDPLRQFGSYRADQGLGGAAPGKGCAGVYGRRIPEGTGA